MGEKKEAKTWNKTNTQNLVRHRSGKYYARLYVAGAERWRSLKTTVLEVAKSRLRQEQQKLAGATPVAKPAKSGRMTVGMALAKVLEEAKARVPMRRGGRKNSITESSAHYRSQTVESLRKSWQETFQVDLDSTEVRKVTHGEVQTWADRMRPKLSATRFNNTLGTLRRAFDFAITAGELHRNPAQEIGRSYKPPKKTYTPTCGEFADIVDAIRNSPSRLADDIADFVELLGYSGGRKEETALLKWSDVDLRTQKVTFTKTKNGEARTIDLIPEAVDLLAKIRLKNPPQDESERIFRVSEAYGALRSAAKKLSLPRISHHDLRDLFATTAIESGADIPTVSDILGHKDGGALLLERYRKHRDEHAKQVTRKISFGTRISSGESSNEPGI